MTDFWGDLSSTPEGCDYQIVAKLRDSGIEVTGHTAIGNEMSAFKSEKLDNKEIAVELFSFLIENNLNRHIFDIFMRLGNLDVNDIPFKQLLANELQGYSRESFVKKYVCPDCHSILFRANQKEIDFRELHAETCRVCDKVSQFTYKDLENDFDVNRNDLIKYLENLLKINVLKKTIKFFCPRCKNKEDLSEPISLQCSICKTAREIKYYYEFNSDFFINALKSKDGRWFEWYVFMLCSYLHYSVDHNLMLKYTKNEEVKEFEIDVIVLDKEGELIVFECKDNVLRETGLGDMQNVLNLSDLFTKTCLISSQKMDKKAQKTIQEKSIAKISFIEGSDLEKQFASEERVLDLFVKDSPYRAARLFERLNDIKQLSITKHIVADILQNPKDTKLLNSLSEIFTSNINACEILKSEAENLKSIVHACLTNIKENASVVESIHLINDFTRIFSVSKLLETTDANTLLSTGTAYLTDISSVGYSERAPFYYFYCYVLRQIRIQSMVPFDDNILQAFFNKFISMLDIYYSSSNRLATLEILSDYWSYLNEANKNKAVRILSSIIESETNGYSRRRLKEKLNNLTLH